MILASALPIEDDSPRKIGPRIPAPLGTPIGKMKERIAFGESRLSPLAGKRIGCSSSLGDE
jgi:hypothetical protein